MLIGYYTVVQHYFVPLLYLSCIRMKATLREKPLKDGRKSLYLDFYPPINHPDTGQLTRREFLGLYVYEKPRLDLERRHNKETRLLGENICAQRQLSIQGGHYGFLKKNTANADILAWFKKYAEGLKHESTRRNWIAAYNHLSTFSGGRLPSNEVTEDFCRKFRAYLITAKNQTLLINENANLSHNTGSLYFGIFKAALKVAEENKVLENDPSSKIKRIPLKETQREFLSMEELQSLAKTECSIPVLKRAALFSALTGLRYSDIEKLLWSEIHSNGANHYLRFKQKKTKDFETLPISESGLALLGERTAAEDKVFPDLHYTSWFLVKLKEWCYKAGIKRDIGFHAFRHTFAVLQLELGTDLYTISKMLGHRDIGTTQIYAKVMDKAKREAAEKIKLTL